MANSENKPSRAGREASGESLPGLLGRVGEDLATLLDAKLGLLKIEIALLNVGIGFLIAVLFEHTQLSQPMKYALGFFITGAMYLLLGGGVIVLNKKRLAGRGIVPERSIAELQKDKQWLKREM